MTPETYRQLRGLALHFRRTWPEIRRAREFTRALISTFGTQKGTTGRCRWCEFPLEQAGRKWHQGCLDSYRVASGQSVTHLWPMYNRPQCPCGQETTELDHRDALVLAWTSGDPRRMMRAHTLGNLTWLCEDCHRTKTASDLQNLADMRHAQTCLVGLIPKDHQAGAMPRRGQTMGLDYWVSVEGGLVRRTLPHEGGFWATKPNGLRGPVTFRPENADCPRCLVAMEHTDPGKHGRSLGMPRGWYIDQHAARAERDNPNGQRHPRKPLSPEESRAAALAAGQLTFIL